MRFTSIAAPYATKIIIAFFAYRSSQLVTALLKNEVTQSEISAVLGLWLSVRFPFQPTTKLLACSRRSDSGARAKTKASERAGKNEGRLGEFTRPLPQSPLVFFPLFRSFYFSLALHYLNAWNRLPSFTVPGNQVYSMAYALTASTRAFTIQLPLCGLRERDWTPVLVIAGLCKALCCWGWSF